MPLRRAPAAVGMIGVVLVGLAPALHFAIVPALTKLPADTHMKLDYSGTTTMLNPAALQENNAADAFLTDIPVTMTRTAKVTSTHGGTAIIRDTVVTTTASSAMPSTHTYAVDRRTLEMVTGPDGVAVEPATGCLAVAFPLDPEPGDVYKVYDTSTQQCATARYKGEGVARGRDVYYYEVSNVGALKDPSLLKALPSELPKTLLVHVAPPSTTGTQSQSDGQSLADLPDLVPLGYIADTTFRFAVDRATGIPVEQALDVNVTAGVDNAGTTTPLAPVAETHVALTADSEKKLSNKARSGDHMLTLVDVIVPVGLAATGMLLILVAFSRRRVRSRPSTAAPAMEP